MLAPATNLLVASISARDHYKRRHLPSGGYPPNSGTSYSAHYVSGLAALVLEENPSLTPVELERIVKRSPSLVATGCRPG